MTSTRWIVAAALLAASVGGTAADAAPKSKAKAWQEVYEVRLYQAVVESPTARSCLAAPRGASSSVRTVVLKHPGTLSARISGFVGSWEVAIYRGSELIERGGGGGVQNVSSTVHARHYVDTSPRYTVHVCNFAGLPHGVVTLTYRPF